MTGRVACIGAGAIGGGIARLAVRGGWQVTLSNSRGPQALAGLLAELGSGASALPLEDAVRAADLIVLSIPFGRYKDLPADIFAGKIVIDTMNYAPGRDGEMAEVKAASLATSPLVQAYFSSARIVKALHNLDYIRLVTSARPRHAPDRRALPIAGDDVAAKEAVGRFLDDIGYDAVDIGGLAESWRCGPASPVYCKAYVGDPPEEFDDEQAKQWFKSTPGIALSVEQVRELAAQAVWHDKMYAGAHANPRGMRAAQFEAGMVKSP